MYDLSIPVDGVSLNVMHNHFEATPSMKPKNDQSIFRSKTREKTSKTPAVTFICMEQLAPDGTTITNLDGKHRDHRIVL